MCMRLLAVVPLLLAACAAQPEGERTDGCGPRRTLYVVNHGWHTGIALAAADLAVRLPALAPWLEGAALVEIGWGDEAFYRSSTPGMWLALRALAAPTDSVLHVVRIAEPDLHAHFPGSPVITLTVPEAGYRAMLDHVTAAFTRAPDGVPVELGDGLYGDSRFYRAEGAFHALNTCNTWVARAVAATGWPLRVRGVVTAAGVLEQIRGTTDARCYAARPATAAD